jgi:prevent-host-death family protein
MEALTEEEAVARWDEIIERVINGEEFIISQNGKPKVKLVPAEDAEQTELAKEPA